MLNIREIRKKTEEARSRSKKDLKARIENYIVNAAERGYNQVHFSSMMTDTNLQDIFNIDSYEEIFGDLQYGGFKITTTEWNIEGGSYRDGQFASIKVEW